MFGMLPFERSDDNLFDTFDTLPATSSAAATPACPPSAPTFGTPETSLS